MTSREIATVDTEKAGCLGVAMLVGVAYGLFKTLDEARSAMIHSKKTYEADQNISSFKLVL